MQWTAILVLISVLWSLAGCGDRKVGLLDPASAPGEGSVDRTLFADGGLAAAVRQALVRPRGELIAPDLLGLQHLDATA